MKKSNQEKARALDFFSHQLVKPAESFTPERIQTWIEDLTAMSSALNVDDRDERQMIWYCDEMVRMFEKKMEKLEMPRPDTKEPQ